VRRPPPTPLIILTVALAGTAAGFSRGGGDFETPAPGPTPAPVAATPEPTPEADTRSAAPRELFASTCGMCHSLRAARVSGMIGPDLDAVRPSAARVRRAIRNGSLDGVMRPGLLGGDDAHRVAVYVARASRR
jgi:mono/diheme cytochrome c family protein